MSELSILIQNERPDDAATIDRLHHRAFGPGRFVRSSERLRESVAPDPRLSFVARVATLVVGALRQTQIRIGEAPALLLGPLTVDPSFMNRGIGRNLLERAIAAARENGHGLILLVGDEPYYARVGFKRVPAGRIQMPGPVDPARVLVWAASPELFASVRGPVRTAS